MSALRIIEVELPSDILLALNEDELGVQKEIKLSYAMRLYQLQKLTIGKAAQLDGISRFEFENKLADNQIQISNLNYEDVLADLEKLR
jgi:predicted HTH domain antitoxin